MIPNNPPPWCSFPLEMDKLITLERLLALLLISHVTLEKSLQCYVFSFYTHHLWGGGYHGIKDIMDIDRLSKAVTESHSTGTVAVIQTAVKSSEKQRCKVPWLYIPPALFLCFWLVKWDPWRFLESLPLSWKHQPVKVSELPALIRGAGGAAPAS